MVSLGVLRDLHTSCVREPESLPVAGVTCHTAALHKGVGDAAPSLEQPACPTATSLS